MTQPERRELNRDGQRLSYLRYPVPQADTAIIVLPAMGVPAGYYERLVGRLTGLGHDVTVADWRGTGDSVPAATRHSRYGYLDLVDDIDALLSRSAPELSGRSITVLGHSLGGHVASLLLARWSLDGHHPVDRLALIACGLPYHRLYNRPKGIAVYSMAASMRLVAAALGHWPGYGFGGRQSRGIIKDWAHTVRTGRFSADDLDAAITHLKLPVLAVTVEDDRFTPASTVRRLTDKYTSAKVTHLTYTHADAGGRIDHFKWARRPDGIIGQISDFANGA